jgi:hypothetical protein
VAAREVLPALALGGTDGTCRRKASRVRRSFGVGASDVDRILVRFGEPGAVRVNGNARQEALVVTHFQCADGSIGRRGLRSGKPSTRKGRVGMTIASSASPNALLLGTRDAACGKLVALWKGAHRPPYEGAEPKVRALKERLVRR